MYKKELFFFDIQYIVSVKKVKTSFVQVIECYVDLCYI